MLLQEQCLKRMVKVKHSKINPCKHLQSSVALCLVAHPFQIVLDIPLIGSTQRIIFQKKINLNGELEVSTDL